MKTKQTLDGLDIAFRYFLLGFLLFNSLIMVFIFVINWEARFFGMILDGLPAGILLSIQFLIPAVLALILIRYPEKMMLVALMALAYFGFFFIDSAITIQTTTGGKVLFGTIPLVSVLIPAVIVISNLLVVRFKNRDEKT